MSVNIEAHSDGPHDEKVHDEKVQHIPVRSLQWIEEAIERTTSLATEPVLVTFTR